MAEFSGTFFNIHFPTDNLECEQAKNFIDLVINEARKCAVDICEGTSFGFNHTRLCVIGERNEYALPFLRVAVGTEEEAQSFKILQVFEQALKIFKDRYSNLESGSEDLERSKDFISPIKKGHREIQFV